MGFIFRLYFIYLFSSKNASLSIKGERFSTVLIFHVDVALENTAVPFHNILVCLKVVPTDW